MAAHRPRNTVEQALVFLNKIEMDKTNFNKKFDSKLNVRELKNE